MPSFIPAFVAAAVALAIVPAAQAEESAALTPLTPIQAMTQLSARGLGELHEITLRDGSYRVVARDGAGRLRELDMDPLTGELAPASHGGLYSNSIDPDLFMRLRGALAPSLPQQARPAHELAAQLMQSGQYSELRDMRFVDDAYRATLRDRQGRTVEVRLDPVSGKIVR